jgi:hypothetical protein
MKRSDMIEIIYNYLLHECGDSYDQAHQKNSKIDAQSILDLIEKAGMLPPFNGTFRQENIVDRWGQDKGITQYRVIVNEWEPEDV